MVALVILDHPPIHNANNKWPVTCINNLVAPVAEGIQPSLFFLIAICGGDCAKLCVDTEGPRLLPVRVILLKLG